MIFDVPLRLKPQFSQRTKLKATMLCGAFFEVSLSFAYRTVSALETF